MFKSITLCALLCIAALFLMPFVFALTAPHAFAAEASPAAAMGLVAQLLGVVPSWLQAASLVVTAASAVAALTPTPKDDGVVKRVRSIIDLLAFNWGGAANKSNASN